MRQQLFLQLSRVLLGRVFRLNAACPPPPPFPVPAPAPRTYIYIHIYLRSLYNYTI